jgi:hypothetical protein
MGRRHHQRRLHQQQKQMAVHVMAPSLQRCDGLSESEKRWKVGKSQTKTIIEPLTG